MSLEFSLSSRIACYLYLVERRSIFIRGNYVNDLHVALSTIGRWSDAGGFGQEDAANYIANNMLWGIVDNLANQQKLARDHILNSTFVGNNGFHASAVGPMVPPQHLETSGNNVPLTTQPPNLLQ